MNTIEIETTKLVSTFDEQFVRIPTIIRLLDNLKDGIYSSYYLTEELQNKLRELKNYIINARSRELIKKDDETELLSFVENALRNSSLTNVEHIRLKKFLSANYIKNEEPKEYEEVTKYLFPFFDDKYLKKIDKNIDGLFKEIEQYQNENAKNKVKDFIYKEDKGKYVVQIFQILSTNWGKGGLSMPTVHTIVNELQKEGIIHTVGGWGSGSRDRLCYPSLKELEAIRGFRTQKENLIKGKIISNLTHLFKPFNARSFAVGVYNFIDDGGHNIYLMAKSILPQNQHMLSIGKYLHEDVISCMYNNFGYKPIKINDEALKREDSLIAFIIRSDDNKIIYRDKENARANELFKGKPRLYKDNGA